MWTVLQRLAPFVALGGMGCAPKNTDMLHFLQERAHKVSAIEYRVGIPDSIAVSAPRILEINGASQVIRPDGKINLKLLGDVKIVGMTAKEIAAKLEVLLSRYYVDPKVNVRVVGHASKKYYVYGEGVGAGLRPYSGRDTLLDATWPAVSNFLAWTSRVKVIRPSNGDAPVRTLRVNIKEMLKTGDWSQNILLEPGDVVYVPPTPFAWLSHRIRELLFPLSPAIQAYAAPAYLRNVGDVYNGEGNSSVGVGGGGYTGP